MTERDRADAVVSGLLRTKPDRTGPRRLMLAIAETHGSVFSAAPARMRESGSRSSASARSRTRSPAAVRARRRRHRNASSQRCRERRKRETRGHDQDDGAEVGDLGHSNRRRPDFPARQRGSLRAHSHQHGRTPRVRSRPGRERSRRSARSAHRRLSESVTGPSIPACSGEFSFSRTAICWRGVHAASTAWISLRFEPV